MGNASKTVADLLVGTLAATSSFWVDVRWYHRIIIGIFVILAMETIFCWLDSRETEHEELEARKQQNRETVKFYDFMK